MNPPIKLLANAEGQNAHKLNACHARPVAPAAPAPINLCALFVGAKIKRSLASHQH